MGILFLIESVKTLIYCVAQKKNDDSYKAIIARIL